MTKIKDTFERLVRPRIGSKSIYELKRRDIVEMLDAIEDENGPVMADRTLAHVRKAFNWWMVQDEELKSRSSAAWPAPSRKSGAESES